MLVSAYLDSIEGTEDEGLFFAKMRELSEIDGVQTGLGQAKGIPFIGKVVTALLAMMNAETVAAFRETAHYEVLKDWSIHIRDLENLNLSLNPSFKQIKKVLPFVAVAAGIILALVLWRRKCCCRKD